MDETREYEQDELEEELLRLLTSGDVSIGIPKDGLVRRCVEHLRMSGSDRYTRVTQALCELARRGLVFVDFTVKPDLIQCNPAHWCLVLTERGRKAVEEGLPNPDTPQSYLERFCRDLPHAAPIVCQYVKEALHAYTEQLYMASIVMLGVASEAAFLDMAGAFSDWLHDKEAENFRKHLDSPRISYNKLLEEFRKRLDPRKTELQPELAENLDVQLNSILNLVRRYRNEAGHPSGVHVDRGACFVCFVAFAEAARRLYALKAFFEQRGPQPLPRGALTDIE